MLILNAAIVRRMGLTAGGLFNAAWSISMQYVLLVLTALGTYYLPALGRLKGSPDAMVLLTQVARVVSLAAPPIITAAVVMKPLILATLYSAAYVDSLQIVRWMLLGDYLKITCWVVAMPALAFADMKTFFWSEVAWFGLFTTLGLLAVIYRDSLEDIGISFLVAYGLYLPYFVVYLRRRFGFRFGGRLKLRWFLGMAAVLAASAATWTSTRVSLLSLGWVALAGLLCLLTLSASEKRFLLKLATRRIDC